MFEAFRARTFARTRAHERACTQPNSAFRRQQVPIHATINSVLWAAHPVVTPPPPLPPQSATGSPPRRCPVEPLTSFRFYVLQWRVLSVNCNQPSNSQPHRPHPSRTPLSTPRKPWDRVGRIPRSRFQHHGQLPVQIVCSVRFTDSSPAISTAPTPSPSLQPTPSLTHPGCTAGQGGPPLGCHLKQVLV